MTGKRCPEKVDHGSMVAALDSLMAQKRRLGARAPKRIYKCPICTGWHLTGQPRAIVHVEKEWRLAVVELLVVGR